MLKTVCREILKEALNKELTREDLLKLKRKISKKYHVKLPKNSDILKYANKEEKEKLLPILLRKPTRSISGVSVIAVMSRPYDCPHGTCLYCARGENAPQSYTGEEPAALRARYNEYDPWRQVRNRISQLRSIGHPTDKAELIVMGGTFPAQPFTYQKEFVKSCLDAMVGERCKTFSETKKCAETSSVRPVGITFETRPDYCKEKEIRRMLGLGATRVELGVQTTYDSIYKKIHRGHTIKDVVEATILCKNAGLKVLYHMMPGLPGSSFEKDLRSFKSIFTDQKFKPDMLKIYPTLVMEGTELYEMWKRGEYEPLSSKKATKLVAEVKKILPRWVRLMRVQRDIPAQLISAGVKKSNLRQLALEKARTCSCIRCREVGHKKVIPENIEIRVERYNASGGKEYFISAEDFDKKVLVGYLRLRKTPDKWIVRELHVYGSEVLIGKEAGESQFQHKGWGKKLLGKAEEIAGGKIYVLSGIGAREYYKKLGYKRSGFFMAKN